MTFNPTKQNALNCENSINILLSKRGRLTDKKKSLELENAKYNVQVRGKTLPPVEYKSICRKQIECKEKLFEIDKSLTEVREQLRKRYLLKEEIRTALPDKETKELLLDLRDKYMGFSSDMTRVSSMRAMASKFAEELESILKII